MLICAFVSLLHSDVCCSFFLSVFHWVANVGLYPSVASTEWPLLVFGLKFPLSDTCWSVLLCVWHRVSSFSLCGCVTYTDWQVLICVLVFLIQCVPSVDLSSCVFLIQGVKCWFVGLWSCVSLTLNVKGWSGLLCLLHWLTSAVMCPLKIRKHKIRLVYTIKELDWWPCYSSLWCKEARFLLTSTNLCCIIMMKLFKPSAKSFSLLLPCHLMMKSNWRHDGIYTLG